jgi:hypothetical protein
LLAETTDFGSVICRSSGESEARAIAHKESIKSATNTHVKMGTVTFEDGLVVRMAMHLAAAC